MIFRKAILFSVLTLAFVFISKCQCLNNNLIKNPGLEEYTCCPYNLSKIYCADFWTQPLFESTSDYFNTCAIDSIINQQIKPLYHHSFFGNGYAGIISYRYVSGIENREYLQGELTDSLLADHCYHVEFWTLLSGHSNTAIDAIGIFFSDSLLKQPYVISQGDTLVYSYPFFYQAQVRNPAENIISDTTNWTKISSDFFAVGNEKYLTIGTFNFEYEVHKFKIIPDIVDYSYYFFDNFSLCPCEDTIPTQDPEPVVYIPNIFTPNNDAHNDVFYVRGQQIESLHLMVYNRWGNKVFESYDIKQGWNGTQNSQKCGEGVFFYVADVGFTNGESTVKKGTVTLVR
ncbi:MAG TPA: gliding motility-associated C-terminal domain-containing protein [Bacteroidales bacterium]|nr:gliding motility-associated C-terminal domain-containing protein [Bacteroidales bacterium]